jgi:peptidoglycan/xylan/chitin deacetylase (PgdA/CDA1 family)
MQGILVVLTYHSIKDNQRDNFTKQMDMATNTGIIEPADIKTSLHDGRSHIAITFDDGYQNILRNALPALKERDMPATVFVTTGYLGERPGWITDRTHPNYDELIISKEQLMSLVNGNIAIGSHTVSHPDLSQVDKQQLSRELTESKRYLDSLLSQNTILCSLPYGEMDIGMSNEFIKAGYERVYLNVPTYPASETRRYFLGRTDASPHDWLLEFRLKLRGAYQWLPLAIRLKKGIIQYVTNNCGRGSIQ